MTTPETPAVVPERKSSVGSRWSCGLCGAGHHIHNNIPVGSAASCGRAARAVVLNEVFDIIITRLEGGEEGVCVVRISGEGVEQTHHSGAK